MKKSIIYLGIALVTFTNVISALAQQSFVKEDSVAQTISSNTNSSGNTTDTNSVESRKRNVTGDQTSSDPETIVVTTYQKTMEEIIAENNQIIESTISPEQHIEKNVTENDQIEISIEVSPVSNDKAIEERILQDLQIIESPVLNDIQPITLRKPKKS